MCVAMVIIHTKTLDKKPVDDVTSTPSLQLHESPTMSQGTALFSCGIMESGRWTEVSRGCGIQQRPVGSSLESLWTAVDETRSAREAGAISGLLCDLSLSEAPSPAGAAPPSKRQCRSLSCSDELAGCRSAWRPQGSRVWTAVEKRRCLSGGSVQRGGSSSVFSPTGFPAMQRSSSFSLPARTNLLEPFGRTFTFHASSDVPQQARYLSQEQISPIEAGAPSEASSPDSTPELERRGGQGGLARSRSQPCVHNDKKTGVKRRRPADSHKQRPSLDLLKMTEKLPDFHSLSCPGFTGDDCPAFAFTGEPLHTAGDVTSSHRQSSDDSWAGGLNNGKERERLWAGLCSGRGRDVFQLGGELDIEQIERN